MATKTWCSRLNHQGLDHVLKDNDRNDGVSGSKCRSPLQITILKLNYTTCRIVQPRSFHKDIDDYLISNTRGFVCMQEN